MGPGPLIAIDVVLLYTILGPLVLFAIYILFDSLDNPRAFRAPNREAKKKAPALWTDEDIEVHLDQI